MKGGTLLVVVALLHISRAFVLEMDPVDPIPMSTTANVELRLNFSATDEDEENLWDIDHFVRLTFNVSDADKSWAIKVLNESLTFDFSDVSISEPKRLSIHGVIVGINRLQVLAEVVSNRTQKSVRPEEEPMLMHETEVRVVVKDRTLNSIFTVVLTVLIIFNTVNMGAQLNIDLLKDVYRTPIGPAVGFASQFLLMPMFSYGIGWLLFTDPMLRLGLFVLGCCPGGAGSNFWCILLNGDLSLSIAMTFTSTVAALGMMPLWLFLLGSQLTQGDLVIPYRQLVTTLIILILPIALGMWIRYRWPKAGQWITKNIVPFTLVIVLFFFATGIYLNWFIFLLLTSEMVAAGFLVAFMGYFFGALLACLFRLNRAKILAVSIETALQNGGIALVLLRLSLPEPEGDLASVAPLAQLIVTASPLWLTFFAIKIYSRFFRKPKPEDQKADQSKKKNKKRSGDKYEEIQAFTTNDDLMSAEKDPV